MHLGTLIATILLVIICLVGSCAYKGYSHIDELKEASPKVWRDQGFTPVAYEGYQMGYGLLGTGYGSAKVWWRLKRPETDTIYSGYVIKWGGEYHAYGPHAVDAIRTGN